MANKQGRRGVGRPKKVIVPNETNSAELTPLKQVELKDVVRVMIDHAKHGGFFSTLGAAFYEAFGFEIAKDTIRRLENQIPDFKTAKSLCKQISSHYWDQQMKLGDVSPAAWIFIKKNLDSWRDRTSTDIKVTEDSLSKLTTEELMKDIMNLMHRLKDEDE